MKKTLATFQVGLVFGSLLMSPAAHAGFFSDLFGGSSETVEVKPRNLSAHDMEEMERDRAWNKRLLQTYEDRINRGVATQSDLDMARRYAADAGVTDVPGLEAAEKKYAAQAVLDEYYSLADRYAERVRRFGTAEDLVRARQFAAQAGKVPPSLKWVEDRLEKIKTIQLGADGLVPSHVTLGEYAISIPNESEKNRMSPQTLKKMQDFNDPSEIKKVADDVAASDAAAAKAAKHIPWYKRGRAYGIAGALLLGTEAISAINSGKAQAAEVGSDAVLTRSGLPVKRSSAGMLNAAPEEGANTSISAD
jgi:hypothetical protein